MRLERQELVLQNSQIPWAPKSNSEYETIGTFPYFYIFPMVQLTSMPAMNHFDEELLNDSVALKGAVCGCKSVLGPHICACPNISQSTKDVYLAVAPAAPPLTPLAS